jgi:hypothetical protein
MLNYWSFRRFERLFRTLPITWSWEEATYMEASYRPHIQHLGRIVRRLPVLSKLIRTAHTGVLFLHKNTENEATLGMEGQRRLGGAA